MRTWYRFSSGVADGDRNDVALLGGKGANLAEMSSLGVPVPPGFTLPTSICAEAAASRELPETLVEALDEGLAFIEESLRGPRFGDPEDALLLSVRSGARVSMPGMMDTVLNVGLTRTSLKGVASRHHRFAYDSYRRLIQMFGDVVMGVKRATLEGPLEALKKERGVDNDSDLSGDDLVELCDRLEKVYQEATGEPFPQDPRVQLQRAAHAVFRSWNTERAVVYRRMHKIPDEWGTAANIQAMVFGNLSERSATGVAFTRDPSTGQKRVLGEWLPNAQGEDVVAGIRTPGPLLEEDVNPERPGPGSLQAKMPESFGELAQVMRTLEAHYRDVQDIEFTIQDGELFLLQTRRAKRTAAAAVKIAVDLHREGVVDECDGLWRVSAGQIDQLLHPQLDPEAEVVEFGQGLPASPGAASGIVALEPEEAVELAEAGTDVILVRQDTSPDDISGMHAARGVLTATGGMTSHAAVVARGMGKPCITGCSSLTIRGDSVVFSQRDGSSVTVARGEELTIDGGTGRVLQGRVPTRDAELSGDLATVLEWADHFRRMKVRANADTPDDARRAVELGAEGIGLCRTEHMFFAPERLVRIRRMILASSDEQRDRALEELKPYQREDFAGIFRAMGERPVTVRLLDPPLHEFLPREPDEIREVAEALSMKVDELEHKLVEMREFNPMLGHRGCRLGITFPAIYAMQVEALVEAACDVKSEGVDVHPEVMIPLVMHRRELEILRAEVAGIVERITKARGQEIAFTIGTMIELPRAAITADLVAEHADFFSFGTNDLTQTALGISRDDGGRFLPAYVSRGIIDWDPFVSLDKEGVGALVELGTSKGRATRPNLKVGICGEHGGDPASIEFFERIGLDYVSCSPFRVPVARVAAAQAALLREHGEDDA